MAARSVYISNEMSTDFVSDERANELGRPLLRPYPSEDRDPPGSCSRRLQSLWMAALLRWPRVCMPFVLWKHSEMPPEFSLFPKCPCSTPEMVSNYICYLINFMIN